MFAAFAEGRLTFHRSPPPPRPPPARTARRLRAMALRYLPERLRGVRAVNEEALRLGVRGVPTIATESESCTTALHRPAGSCPLRCRSLSLRRARPCPTLRDVPVRVVNAPLERCRSRHGRQLPYVLRDRGSHRRAHQRHLTTKSPPIRTYGWRLPRASPPNPGRTAWHDWQFELSPPSKRLLRPANAWPTGGATRPCRTRPFPGSLGRVETGERTRLTVSARASVRCRRKPRGARR
jgi:hypothetical protein